MPNSCIRKHWPTITIIIKEAALTEILRFYVNNDIKDSTNVYMEEAKRELKGKARDFLVTYMQTIIDVRVVFYTEGEDRKKLIEQYRLKLETDKNLSVLEKNIDQLCARNGLRQPGRTG